MVSFFRRLFEMSAPVLMSSSDAAVKWVGTAQSTTFAFTQHIDTLTPTLSRSEILNDATFVIQNKLVSRLFNYDLNCPVKSKFK